MKRIFPASFFLIAVSLSSSFGQWEKTNGPRNYWITQMALLNNFQVALSDEIAFNRAGASLIWSAATGLPVGYRAQKLFHTSSAAFLQDYSKGFYRTTDGVNWSAMTFPDTNLVFNDLFTPGDLLFAEARVKGTSPTMYRLFLSANDGETWLDVSPLPTIFSVNTVIKEGPHYRVYLWNTPDGSPYQVYQSLNGSDWTFLSTSQYIPNAAIAGRQLNFSTVPHGYYRYSDNNGASWSASQILPKPEGGFQAAFQNNGALFACFYANYRAVQQIYRTDDGINWTLLPNVPPLYTPPVLNDNVLYAIGDFNQVYASTDNGNTWAAEGVGLPSDFMLEGIAFHVGQPIAYGIGGIYTRSSSNTIWAADHEGLPELDFYAMKMATWNDALIAGGQGLFRTTDHGNTWEKINDGLPRLQFFFYYYSQMLATNSRLTIGGGGYLHHSYDGGNTWEQTPYDPDWRDEHGSFCLLTGIGDTLFACKNDSAIYRLYRSYDGGVSWDLLGNTPGNPSGKPFGPFYANGRLFLERYESGQILTSHDQGLTWPDNYYNGEFGRFDAMAYADGFYYASGYGFNLPDKKILRSTDGANWEKIVFDPTPGSFETRDLLAKDSLLIIATENTGVFLSHDYGSTWENITHDEPGILNVLSLAMDDIYLYVGTVYNGVWRRLLTDFEITATSDPANLQPSITISPNPAAHFVQIETMPENSTEDSATLSVFDAQGKLVLNRSFQSREKLDVSQLPAGVYFLRITQKGLSHNSKFVKK